MSDLTLRWLSLVKNQDYVDGAMVDYLNGKCEEDVLKTTYMFLWMEEVLDD